MRLRLFSTGLLASAALFFAAGCDRGDTLPFTAEVDEPEYRHGKEMLKQGRNQEALSDFQKVIEKRGLLNAPEAHLELGLLYQQHIRDPIQAIYHFRKYRELKPSTQQAELVRLRIDAAMREFASTLPGKPLDSPLAPSDYPEVLQQLKRENDQLRSALANARASVGLSPRPPVDAEGRIVGIAPEETPAQPSPISAPTNEPSPVILAPEDTPATEPIVAPPLRPQQPIAQTPPAPTPTARPATQAGGRRHVVKPKENLYSIARQYYGTGSNAKVDEIFRANRDRMKTPTDLKIGMELRIP